MRTIVRKALGIATVAAGLAFGGVASADPINVTFNINTTTFPTCNNADLGLATSCTTGAPNTTAATAPNNIGLVFGVPIFFSSIMFGADTVPLIVGQVFTKIFETAVGTFTETLTVTLVESANANSVHMEASGTISCAGGCLSTLTGNPLDPTAVFFSVSYTKNPGDPAINASFNNSTVPGQTPEPGTLALLGLGLAAFAFARRRKQS